MAVLSSSGRIVKNVYIHTYPGKRESKKARTFFGSTATVKPSCTRRFDLKSLRNIASGIKQFLS